MYKQILLIILLAAIAVATLLSAPEVDKGLGSPISPVSPIYLPVIIGEK